MLKAARFQESDLFRCGQACALPLLQTIKEQLRLACVLDLVREDAALFERCLLLVGRRCAFPAERRDIPAQILRTDRHFVLQWIYELTLALLALCKLIRECFFSLLLERLAKRRDAGLATPKQIRVLEKYGFVHVGEWAFDAASSMISRIAANNWRGAPNGVDPATFTPAPVQERFEQWT